MSFFGRRTKEPRSHAQMIRNIESICRDYNSVGVWGTDCPSPNSLTDAIEQARKDIEQLISETEPTEAEE